MSETEWGPWIEWKGGECPIPEAKAGEWQCKLSDPLVVHSFYFEASGPVNSWLYGAITAYRTKAADPYAEAKAAWRDGELQVEVDGGWRDVANTCGIPWHAMGSLGLCFRRRPKPSAIEIHDIGQDAEDWAKDTGARDTLEICEPVTRLTAEEKLAAVSLPKSDLPGIAAEAMRRAMTPPVIQPTPKPQSKPNAGLYEIAPMGRVGGGKWGL